MTNGYIANVPPAVPAGTLTNPQAPDLEIPSSTAARLLDHERNTNGAGMVAYNPALDYPAWSIGKFAAGVPESIFATLAEDAGATLIGTPGGSNVQLDLNARPTSTTLALSGAAATIGSTGPSNVQADLNARPTSANLAASTGATLVGSDLDPGFSAPMTAAEALSLRFNVWNYLTAAERVDAGTGAPVIDTSAKIQTAIDRALLFGRPLDCFGTYRVGAQKIVIKCDADFSEATFFVYGSPAVAVEVSTGNATNPTSILYNKIILMPKRMENKGKPGTGWAGQGIGLRIVDTYSCEIHPGNIVGFAIGVQETSYGVVGNVYNEIHIGHLENNAVNYAIDEGDATAWVNENDHYGGRFSHVSGEGVNVAGTRHIRIAKSTLVANNHVFIKPSLEGDTAEYHVENGGSYNTIIQGRWEATTPKVLYTGDNANQGASNMVFGGYGAQNIVFTYAGTTGGNNAMRAPRGTYESLTEGSRVQNQSSSSSPVLTIYPAGTRPEGAGASVWNVKLSALYLQGKASADANDRVRIDYSNGRMLVGNASATPTAWLGNVGAANTGTNVSFLPSVTASIDLGSTSQRWNNTYSANFRPGAGTATWTSGTGTPEAAVTATVGSLFARTDGAAGSTLYSKESGAGNTGWVTVGTSIASVATTTTLTISSASTTLADASGGAVTVNLPTAASMTGRVINIKKIDASANAVTIDANGAEVIDGATTLALSAQWQSAQIQSNGTEWYSILNAASGVLPVANGGTGVTTLAALLGALSVNTQPTFRNLAQNGDMFINQTVQGATTTTGTFLADGWALINTATARLTGSQSTSNPAAGFLHSLLATVTTSGSPAAGDLHQFQQGFEGTMIKHLNFGSASAASITISLWVRSSVTGTYALSVRNGAVDRSYVTPLVVNAANTWEYKTFVIPGDATGTWVTTTAAAMYVNISMAVGTTSQTGTSNTWLGSNVTGLTGQTQLTSTNGATFQAVGFQLERGIIASPYEYVPFDVALPRAYRYYYQSYAYGTAVGASDFANDIMGVASDVNSLYVGDRWPVIMRAVPTVLAYALAGTANRVRNSATGAEVTVTAYNAGTKGMITMSSAAGFTASTPYDFQVTASARI